MVAHVRKLSFKKKISFLPFTIIFLVLYLIKEGHEQFQSTPRHIKILVWNWQDFQKCNVIPSGNWNPLREVPLWEQIGLEAKKQN